MTTLQHILQETSKLTISEKRSLAQFLLEQAAQDAREAQGQPQAEFARPDMERRLERQWLKENWQTYLGQWVCLEGNQLIDHGLDGKQVYATAKAAGIQVPYLVRVEDPTLPQMGGW